MHESLIFTLLILVFVLIFYVLYIWHNQAAANFNKNPTYGQSFNNSFTNEPINKFESANFNLTVETITKSFNKYGKEQCSPCGIKINGDMLNNSPIISPHNQLEYLQPNSSGEIALRLGQWVSLRCADGFAEPFEGQTLQAQCAGDKNFLINNEKVNFSKINCTTMSTPTPIPTGLCCSGEGTELINIGNKFNESLLITMQVCFDKIRQTTLYVIHKITPASVHYKHHVKPKNFTSGDFFFKRKIDDLYTRNKQLDAFENILGKGVYYDYIKTEKNRLSRGHLVAKTDLIYSGQQKGTFHHLNVVPQWRSFNGGNWSRIEDGVRQFAHDNNLTLLCWTGTWGVCTLPDVNNVQRELYLRNDEQNNNLIPVPKLLYRIVIDEKSRKGITFVGVNNPYVTIEQMRIGGYFIGDDVSDNIDWIAWDRQNIEKGYCYACSVPDFVAVVNGLPLVDLETTGILGLKEYPI